MKISENYVTFLIFGSKQGRSVLTLFSLCTGLQTKCVISNRKVRKPIGVKLEVNSVCAVGLKLRYNFNRFGCKYERANRPIGSLQTMYQNLEVNFNTIKDKLKKQFTHIKHGDRTSHEINSFADFMCFIAWYCVCTVAILHTSRWKSTQVTWCIARFQI